MKRIGFRIILLLIGAFVAIISYYYWVQRRTQVFAERFMGSVISFARFEDVPLDEAAREIWTKTIDVDPFFEDKKLVIDLINPEQHWIRDYQLLNCPSREWFNYFGQITGTRYQIHGDTLYVTDRGWDHDHRPWIYRKMEEAEAMIWFQIHRFRRQPTNPSDPFLP